MESETGMSSMTPMSDGPYALALKAIPADEGRPLPLSVYGYDRTWVYLGAVPGLAGPSNKGKRFPAAVATPFTMLLDFLDVFSKIASVFGHLPCQCLI